MKVISKNQRVRTFDATKLINPILGTSLIFLASMFSAILFTETIQQQEWSQALPAYYWLLLPTAAASGMIFARIFARKNYLWKFFGFMLAELLVSLYDGLLNNTPLLQVFWFISIALVLGILAFSIPGVVLRGHSASFRPRVSKLYKSNYLTQLWTKYSIQARYSQKVLGIGWVMLYPLLEAIVIGFAFAVLMGRSQVAGKPFIIFLLSGIVLFNLFSRTVNRSTTSLLGAMGVIKQIYFPREVILFVSMGEELVNFVFTFLTLLLVNAIYGTFPNLNYLILFLPLLIMAGMAFGTSLFASFGNLVFRDLQQLILLVMRLLFYVTVLFSLRVVSPELAIFGLINPLTVLVEFFRTIILYEQSPEFAVLVWPAALAIALLYSGYIFFTHNEDRFIDFS